MRLPMTDLTPLVLPVAWAPGADAPPFSLA